MLGFPLRPFEVDAQLDVTVDRQSGTFPRLPTLVGHMPNGHRILER